MLIVCRVVEYLEGRAVNSAAFDVGEHNNKKMAALTPLLMVSERWRMAALESICDNCVLSFASLAQLAYPKDGVSTVDIAYAAMILAVLCPDFAHVALPPRLRRDFGREIARASVDRVFKPYAATVSRLIYPELGY